VNSPQETLRSARIALIGFPNDDNSSFVHGAAKAPPLIRLALFSEASNLWSENSTNLGADSLIFDAGDIAADAGAAVFSEIETSVLGLLDRRLLPIALGGDHAITYPVIRAMSRKHSGLTVLDFDAHPDLYDEFEGSRHSHACPFARIMEEGLVRRLVQIGIRTMNGHQRRQAERFGVEVIEMKDWCDVLPELRSPLYISFDMDALDPAFAPGVSHREPGGLSVRQALSAIQTLRAAVVGADIVEFNPRFDASNLTAIVCAKLVKEIAAKMLETTEGE
jgi:agmatinase